MGSSASAAGETLLHSGAGDRLRRRAANRELPDGKLVLIDGYLRAEITQDQTVPVLVLDVTEAEADKILLTLDPLAGMAEKNSAAVEGLLPDGSARPVRSTVIIFMQRECRISPAHSSKASVTI